MWHLIKPKAHATLVYCCAAMWCLQICIVWQDWWPPLLFTWSCERLGMKTSQKITQSLSEPMTSRSWLFRLRWNLTLHQWYQECAKHELLTRWSDGRVPPYNTHNHIYIICDNICRCILLFLYKFIIYICTYILWFVIGCYRFSRLLSATVRTSVQIYHNVLWLHSHVLVDFGRLRWTGLRKKQLPSTSVELSAWGCLRCLRRRDSSHEAEELH